MAINEDIRLELDEEAIVFDNPYAGEMAPVVMFTFKEDTYGDG